MNALSASLSRNISLVFEHSAVRWLVLIVASFLVLFAQANHVGIRGDSIYYAALARRIADSGEYATLRFGHELNHHGPLVFWLTALSIKLLGPTGLGATLVSRLFAFGCVVLTAVLGDRLLGKNVGWFAGLALTLSYVFFRNAVTLRLETALMFGVLLALLGYFCGSRSWGPPVFYSGVAVAILAKSVAGFLPLGLVGFHALLAGRLRLPWHKDAVRWVLWSFLLLVPLAWWAYLAKRYGMEVFSIYVTDFMDPKGEDASRLGQFFQIYLSDLGFRYWPWLPFALVGSWILCRNAADPEQEREERASAAFIVGWFAAVLFAGVLKPAQYGRYLLPAYPALSMMTGAGIKRVVGGKLPAWIPESVAAATLIAAITLACFPTEAFDQQNLSAIAAVLDRRLPPGAPVAVVTTASNPDGTPRLSWTDEGRCQFFFGRAARATTVAAASDAASRGRITFLTTTGSYPRIAATVKLTLLLRAENYVLAEMGTGEETLLP